MLHRSFRCGYAPRSSCCGGTPAVRSPYRGDPSYGARPLRRALQKRIEDPLATLILKGEFPEGNRVTVDVDPKGGFTFTSSAS